jgi:hypothetical protein
VALQASDAALKECQSSLARSPAITLRSDAVRSKCSNPSYFKAQNLPSVLTVMDPLTEGTGGKYDALVGAEC